MASNSGTWFHRVTGHSAQSTLGSIEDKAFACLARQLTRISFVGVLGFMAYTSYLVRATARLRVRVGVSHYCSTMVLGLRHSPESLNRLQACGWYDQEAPTPCSPRAFPAGLQSSGDRALVSAAMDRCTCMDRCSLLFTRFPCARALRVPFETRAFAPRWRTVLAMPIPVPRSRTFLHCL